MSNRPLPDAPALRSSSTTFTRLGAALASCAQRAEQHARGAIEPNAELLHDLRIALQLAPTDADTPPRGQGPMASPM